MTTYVVTVSRKADASDWVVTVRPEGTGEPKQFSDKELLLALQQAADWIYLMED